MKAVNLVKFTSGSVVFDAGYEFDIEVEINSNICPLVTILYQDDKEVWQKIDVEASKFNTFFKLVDK